jgi:hypothetical protein
MDAETTRRVPYPTIELSGWSANTYQIATLGDTYSYANGCAKLPPEYSTRHLFKENDKPVNKQTLLPYFKIACIFGT